MAYCYLFIISNDMPDIKIRKFQLCSLLSLMTITIMSLIEEIRLYSLIIFAVGFIGT